MMRKTFILFVFAAIGLAATAQINPHALGLRFGGTGAFGTEISYQGKISSSNRLEGDLGFYLHPHYSAVGLTGIYQWVWDIDGGFNWFLGVGGQIGSWDYDHDYYHNDNAGVWLSAMGQIGLEYQFSEIPFQLGVDLRPVVGLVNPYYDDGFNLDLGVSFRYIF
jgi:hypothetical protein